jgi:SAM-dependent methyltransferase
MLSPDTVTHQQSIDCVPDAGAFGIRFPEPSGELSQDEEWFEFDLEGRTRRLRLHDYADIYRVPGLYEALVYDALGCRSPERLVGLLAEVLADWPEDLTGLRVLDLGAGNGMVAAALRSEGIEPIVGLDLLPEAAMAARRDHRGAYADYVVTDLADPDRESRERLEAARLTCLTTVATLGFGDIPPRAFANAFGLIATNGWLAMTIKEDFLLPGDDSGFARLLRELVRGGSVEIHAQLRFCHRLSIGGERLFYVALVARKKAELPAEALAAIESGMGLAAEAPRLGPLSVLPRA